MGCLCPKPLSLYLAPKVSTDDVSLIANCNLCQINPYVLILRTFPTTSASAADQIDDCSVECGGFYVGGFSVSELVHQRHHQCTAASCWGGGRPTASKDGSWWVQHRENGNRRPVMACIYQAWLLAERQTIMWLTGYQMGTKLQEKFWTRQPWWSLGAKNLSACHPLICLPTVIPTTNKAKAAHSSLAHYIHEGLDA